MRGRQYRKSSIRKERECCLLVLNLVSSTLKSSIRKERECCLLVLNLVSSTLKSSIRKDSQYQERFR
jgi:hypothetical protein